MTWATAARMLNASPCGLRAGVRPDTGGQVRSGSSHSHMRVWPKSC